MSIENNLKKINENTTELVQLLSRAVDALESLAGMPVMGVDMAKGDDTSALLQPQAPGNVVNMPAPNPAPPQQEQVIDPNPNVPPTNSLNEPVLQAPFTDQAGLVNYVMGKYNSMGPEKGAEIQKEMVKLGYNNINEVQPENYNLLFTRIEAIK